MKLLVPIVTNQVEPNERAVGHTITTSPHYMDQLKTKYRESGFDPNELEDDPALSGRLAHCIKIDWVNSWYIDEMTILLDITLDLRQYHNNICRALLPA